MASRVECCYIRNMLFPPIDPDRLAARKKRFRAIPVRVLLPNLITLLSLCAGLTAIRLAIEGRLEWALGAIVFAAILDGVDGRLARMLKGQSRFGAELDSLADFVNFGVVPGLILYFWGLNELGSVGWIAALASSSSRSSSDGRSSPRSYAVCATASIWLKASDRTSAAARPTRGRWPHPRAIAARASSSDIGAVCVAIMLSWFAHRWIRRGVGRTVQ